MTPEQEQQQRDHADEIKQRADARRQGGEQISSELKALIQAEIKTAVDAAINGIVIQGGQGVIVSGGGKNWTIASQAMTWTGTGICNGDGSVTISLKSN